MRDQARQFSEAGCDILGVSFDSVEDNREFREEHHFPFPLLSDPSREVGGLYETVRDPDDKFADFPLRISYLIDPDGEIVMNYEVSDPGGHALVVLADLAAAQR